MHYHKEGNKTILISALLILLMLAVDYLFLDKFPAVQITIAFILVVLLFLIIRFFRVPHREVRMDNSVIYAPADGKVVVIEEVMENEYFKDRRKQVSVFMSPLDVHVNYFPIRGLITYFKYHAGKYLVAWHPKSSEENERTTVVIKHPDGYEILMRQIAGAMARRIICYAKEGNNVQQCSELGFIKFGSRVDLFLPLDCEILVELGQHVKAPVTPVAKTGK